MATISKKLTIEDRFSGPLDTYIEKLENTANSLTKVEEYEIRVADAGAELTQKWADLGDMLQQSVAESNMSIKDLVKQGYAEMVEKTDLAAEKTALYTDELSKAAVAEEDASEGAEEFSRSIKKAGDRAEKTGNTIGTKLMKRLTAMALFFVSTRRLIKYFREAAERAPDSIANKFQQFGKTIKDTFAQVVVGFMDGFSGPLEKITELLQSDRYERFIKILIQISKILGEIVGGLLYQLLQMLFAVGDAVGELADTFNISGQSIANVIAVLYAGAYNSIADIWNFTATFAEFLVNVWKYPEKAINELIYNIASNAIAMIANVATALGVLFGKDWGAELKVLKAQIELRAKAQRYFNEQSDPGMAHFDRLETVDAGEIANKWANSLSAENISKSNYYALKNIDKNTASVAKAITGEDLKLLVDLAERAFVANVNLTNQTPVITINGANTGNTEEDRRSLARAIETILVEQLASGSTSSPMAYAGG